MFQDEDTTRIDRAMGSVGHPYSTIQGSMRHLSLMRAGPLSNASLDQANNLCSRLLFKLWWGISVFDETRPFFNYLGPTVINSHYPRPGLNVVINPYKLA